ncbi:MAG: HEPN domain-containing protein [Ignavibacteriae bacterium]|nr:HEPN domain-containing protein [Ignavibacteriota bacterium]
MRIEEQIKYWMNSAESDLPVAERLFKMGDYNWCLYIGHLVLEKILKAHFVKDNNKIPPKTHDLLKLVNSTSLILDDEKKLFLNRVNTFNIEVRYPEDKQKFYQLCTQEFADKNFKEIKEIYNWLKSQIQ